MLKGSPRYINMLDKALSDAVNFGLQLKHIHNSFQFANITVFLGSDRSAAVVVLRLRNFRLECKQIEDALYSQKHAFNFIYLRRLTEACKVHICLL